MTDSSADKIIPKIIEVDVVVIGGGIAGLWLLNRLRQTGYSALLLEKTALGSGQTVASQGMIHGGLKYALAGTLTGATESIKQMPQIWQRCLDGCGEIDLSRTHKLSDDFYLWSAGNVGSRLVSFFASKSLRGQVEKVKRPDFPPLFAGSPYKGTIYRLQDVVLDMPSLLANLSQAHRPVIAQADSLRWQNGDQGVELLHCGEQLAVRAQRYVVTAGEGAGDILAALNIQQPAMQLRPLQQVMVKHELPYKFYGHCIGAQTSASPRLTISTHPCRDGKLVWYLGGDLATEGVGLPSEQLIDRARQELASLFPWLDFSAADWATATINRAEPLQEKLLKPDTAFASDAGNKVIFAWPTKLTLAPDLSQRVLDLLQGQIQPRAGAGLEWLDQLPKPAIATPIWDQIWG